MDDVSSLFCIRPVFIEISPERKVGAMPETIDPSPVLEVKTLFKVTIPLLWRLLLPLEIETVPPVENPSPAATIADPAGLSLAPTARAIVLAAKCESPVCNKTLPD